MVARCESAALAHKLISETCAREGIVAGQLTLHAKYRPGFPERFGEIEDARGFSADFFAGITMSITTAASPC
jgi:hypothetical protein